MTSNTVVSSSTLTGALAFKVSFGNEIRRANFEGSSFVLLRGLVAKLFELDPQVVVLKYQDEDGDNITMSSDAELQDALNAAQPKLLLRLVLDTKTPIAPPVGDAPRSTDSQSFGSWGPGLYGHHGPYGGPFGGPHHGGPHGPRGPHHGGPHGPHHGGPFGGPHHGGPFGPFGPRGHGPFRGGHHGFRGRYSPFAAPFVPGSDLNGEGCPPAHPWGGYNHQRAAAWDKKAFKEHKRDVKKQIQLLKMKASTPEDFAAIREMKLQLKGYKKEVKGYKKDCKEKKDKKDKKDKRDKRDKKDKKEKKYKERFAAKHVADLTIPDNSELPADTPVTKTWRMRNCGEQAWPVDSQLIFISHKGDNLNGPERVLVGTVQPQHEVDISVTFLTPSEPGRYVGYYRMATANGAKFGQRVWVSFFVPVRPAVQPEVSALGALVNEITMD